MDTVFLNKLDAAVDFLKSCGNIKEVLIITDTVGLKNVAEEMAKDIPENAVHYENPNAQPGVLGIIRRGVTFLFADPKESNIRVIKG